MNNKFNAKSVKAEIVRWIANYFKNNADSDTKAVIGISGGKDSTITAALCAEAIGRERVIGVLMPQGEQSDISVSYAVCRHLGIEHIKVNIGETAETLYNAVNTELNDVARLNTPARIRMTVLYAIAGSVGGRVVNNCNASEIFVGWGTKFGDMAGDFSPLSDLTVKEVKAIGYELGLPTEFIEKTPIDGLCGKSDEESLGFSYDVLDKYIRSGVCDDKQAQDRITKLHALSEHKRNPIPRYRNSGE
jgi:NAD+ synthase